MRIVAVSHASVTDVNQQFYAELEKAGNQVHLIIPSNFRSSYSDKAIHTSRWPSFSGTIEQRKIALSNNIPLHFYQSNLRPSMDKFQPDVLFVEEEPYSASAWQAYYASRHLPIKRVIYSAQNIVKKYPPPFRWMEQYVLSRSDMAAVVSDKVGEVMRAKGFSRHLLPFPLGVDTTQFRPNIEARSTKRWELGISDRFVIGYVGRFVEEKGIHTLLEAIPFLTETNVKFVFVGNGPLLDEIKEVKGKYPDMLTIADDVKHRDVHLWINAFDVLVLPSLTKPNWKEQFGRVIIEAMACQVPVVGSDSGEIPVLVNKTGGGWCFPEGNVQEFIKMIGRLSADDEERNEKARKGLAHVQSVYSKRALATSFSTALQSMIYNSKNERIVR